VIDELVSGIGQGILDAKESLEAEPYEDEDGYEADPIQSEPYEDGDDLMIDDMPEAYKRRSRKRSPRRRSQAPKQKAKSVKKTGLVGLALIVGTGIVIGIAGLIVWAKWKVKKMGG
jgi:hypothetical protein